MRSQAQESPRVIYRRILNCKTKNTFLQLDGTFYDDCLVQHLGQSAEFVGRSQKIVVRFGGNQNEHLAQSFMW